MSYLMPEFTKTCLTPGTSEILRSRSVCPEWSMGRWGQGLDPRHLRSVHLPDFSLRGHSMPYMLAVGPPTSWMTPLNPGLDAMRPTSLRMDSSDLETTVVPWWTAIAQNEQSP